MRVVIAPDSFGGTLTSAEAASAIARGWCAARPDDKLTQVPLADGGEGTLEVVAAESDQVREVEVADPLGRPRVAGWLRRADGTAVIASAEACGLRWLHETERDPLQTTTYGVGQLLEAARRDGAGRIAVGLGGSATVDGGAGALTALGVRVLREDGNGLKIGGGELRHVGEVERGRLAEGWSDVDVVLWTDVETPLTEAAATYGPQKGATPEAVGTLHEGLMRWADVVERDLGGVDRRGPGTGAAGGLGFGLSAALGARFEPGAATIAEAVGLADAVRDADLVITGEGRLDATSGEGKVVAAVLAVGRDAGVPVAAVVGRLSGLLEGPADIEEAAPDGPGDDPAAEVAGAAERLASRA